jgi:hypothetical protein
MAKASARSRAAKRGWETRRHNERSRAAKRGWKKRKNKERREHKKRSDAAKRGWKKRREKEKLPPGGGGVIHDVMVGEWVVQASYKQTKGKR